MSFKKEKDMYAILASYINEDNRFKDFYAVINKIKFKLLKGWKIDVAGYNINNENIIAIEAKKDIGPYSVMQAISQAEMYQKITNEAYVAFPESDIITLRRESIDEWNNILNICRNKGIGIISVNYDTCRIINEALRKLNHEDIYNDVKSQLEYETLNEFNGFKYEDFHFFNGYAEERKYLLREKIELYVESIKNYILTNPNDYQSFDSRKLVVELPSRGFSHTSCWFFIAEVERINISRVPHYNIKIDGESISCCVNLETLKTTNYFKNNVNENYSSFKRIINNLHKKSDEYNIKILEAIRMKGPYRSSWPWKHRYTINSGSIEYLSKDVFVKMLDQLKYPVIRFFAPSINANDEIINTYKVVNQICEYIRDLQTIYDFCKE